MEDNDVFAHQHDQYYVTEIQERRSKILEENQRCLKYESLIETYNEELQKVNEDIEALGLDDDALKMRVNKQKDAITKIAEECQKAQNSKDHYEKQRKKYSSDLNRLKDERKRLEAEIEKLTARAMKTVPNRPDVIPADENKERARIDTQQREFAQNRSYIERADEIEENYRNITEVRFLFFYRNTFLQFNFQQYKKRKIELKQKKAVLKVLEQRLDERHERKF